MADETKEGGAVCGKPGEQKTGEEKTGEEKTGENQPGTAGEEAKKEVQDVTPEEEGEAK